MTTVIRWKCCANPSIDTSRSKPEIGKTSPKVNKKFTQINCLCSIHSQICPRGRHPQRFPAAGAGMVVLIDANSPGLARIWSRHLERAETTWAVVHSQADAVNYRLIRSIDVILLDLGLENGSAIAIADCASDRWPRARVMLVSKSTFFSGGSIFNHIPNAAAIVGYHGGAS